MLGAVSLPFTGQAWSCKRLTRIVHILSPETDDWQKGENDGRKYFIINLHERMLPNRRGLNPDRKIHNTFPSPKHPINIMLANMCN